MSGEREIRHWLLTGRVQRVGFRHYTRVQARELGLVGTVANLDDGRVEVKVAGAPGALDDFERRVRQGPRAGRVDRLESVPADDSLERQAATWDDFQVVR